MTKIARSDSPLLVSVPTEAAAAAPSREGRVEPLDPLTVRPFDPSFRPGLFSGLYVLLI
jgi:hypothetical protein